MFAACRTKIDAALTGRDVCHLDSLPIRNERIILLFFYCLSVCKKQGGGGSLKDCVIITRQNNFLYYGKVFEEFGINERKKQPCKK